MGMAALEGQISELPESEYNSGGVLEEGALRRLQSEAAEIVEKIAKVMDDMSIRLLECSTRKEFDVLRKDTIFPAYLKLGRAFTNIALATLKREDYAYLQQESLAETEKYFIDQGSAYFSTEAHQEVLFSIATLRNARRLIPRILSAQAAHPEEDTKLAHQYLVSSTWVYIHMNCLKLAVQHNKKIAQEILQELLEGLRHSVMVYAYARAALGLRGIGEEQYADKPESSWDAEDQALANAD